MGRQTRFYVHPDDYVALADGLRSLGAVVIARRSPNGEPVIRDVASERGSVKVHLTRPEDLAALHPRHSEHQQTWFYSVSDDPLVELSLLQPRDGVTRLSRVYFEPRALAGDMADLRFEDKPPDFVAFAERVRRWIRRWCQKREGMLLSPSLVARFDGGQVAIQGDMELLTELPQR